MDLEVGNEASMDSTGNGEVTKDELYAGLLLVHLNLAKFAGAAACYVSTHKDDTVLKITSFRCFSSISFCPFHFTIF